MKNPNVSFVTLVTLLQLAPTSRGLAISLAHCEKNISVKYQVPVTKTRLVAANAAITATTAEIYIDYEERLRWDVVQICCPGQRTIIFGLCEAICSESCPPHSACTEPNKCKCSRGYEPSHHPNKDHPLICRPVCPGGCPAHSHCVSPDECECRVGYRDVSTWFTATRCEHVHCGPEQHYDALRRGCVRSEVKVEEPGKDGDGSKVDTGDNEGRVDTETTDYSKDGDYIIINRSKTTRATN